MKNNTIPLFPNFRKIDLIDEKDIKVYTDKYKPYSDYNFVSLYSYGVGVARLSDLYGNLVVLSEDYINENLFFGFIGNSKINETIDILLKESIKRNILNELRLIPEDCIKNINNKFEIIEDFDSHDYILSSNLIYNYIGRNLRNKKNLLNRFNKNNYNININYIYNKNQILELFDLWSYTKNDQDTDVEKIAILNLLSSDDLKYNYIGIEINKKLVAFFVYEIVNEYCILHFIKYDIEYVGICSFTYKLLAKKAIDNNCNYINIEQDLGLEGLRKAKKQLCPVDYLKKYIIKYKK